MTKLDGDLEIKGTGVSLGKLANNFCKVINYNNSNGSTIIYKNFNVRTNSSVLVLSSAGLLYVTFLYDPSTSSFYIGEHTRLSGSNTYLKIAQVSEKVFQIAVPAWATATLIFNNID